MIKELKKKTDQELNKIFIEEVLEFETETANNGEGYWIFLNKIDSQPQESLGHIRNEKRRYIASTYFRPTADRNLAQAGVSRCPGKLYFETVCELVRQRYSEANDFEMSYQSQDYIQSTCREMVLGCIIAIRTQS